MVTDQNPNTSLCGTVAAAMTTVIGAVLLWVPAQAIPVLIGAFVVLIVDLVVWGKQGADAKTMDARIQAAMQVHQSSAHGIPPSAHDM